MSKINEISFHLKKLDRRGESKCKISRTKEIKDSNKNNGMEIRQ